MDFTSSFPYSTMQIKTETIVNVVIVTKILIIPNFKNKYHSHSLLPFASTRNLKVSSL